MSRTFAPCYHVTGRSNLPYGHPVIFASNHISDVDPPLIGAALRSHPAYMAKRDLWDIGWLGHVLTFVGSFPIDPGSPDRAGLRRAREILSLGTSIVMFPEGKISATSELLPILPGALSLAMNSGVPVIPVGLWGAQHIMPYGETVPRITTFPVRSHFGKALSFADLKELPGKKARERGTERLESAMREVRAVAMGEKRP